MAGLPILELAIFIVGFAIMATEICGARLLEPYFGNTLFTWTSSISVILAALGAGYYLGGKVTVGKARKETLALMIAAAAVVISIIPFASSIILNAGMAFGYEFGPLFSSAILFGLPNILLGMAAPYAIKLNAKILDTVGRIAGNLYAISTFGGIVGALLSGYVMIPYVGINETFFAAGLALGIVAVLLYGIKLAPMIAIIILVAMIHVPSPYAKLNPVYQAETPYYSIAVIKSNNNTLLLTSLNGAQSASNYSAINTYYPYQRIMYNGTQHLNGLYLGLGGGAMITDLYKNTNASIDVVEIDPGVISAARTYFGFNESRVSMHNQDARYFLRDTNSTYDMIVLDTYGSSVADMPSQMVTLEAADEMKNHLGSAGAVMINLISPLSGASSCAFRSVYKTFGLVFKHVYVFPLNPNNPDALQNVEIIATDANYSTNYVISRLNNSVPMDQASWVESGSYNSNFNTSGCQILTDNRNPFEYYSAQALVAS